MAGKYDYDSMLNQDQGTLSSALGASDSQRSHRSNLRELINQNKVNQLGGPAGSSPGDIPAATAVSPVIPKDNEPYSDVVDRHMARNSLSHKDPYAFNQISYPSDVTTNIENGHYMLFYVNVQNKSKYHYKDYKGIDVGGVTTIFNEAKAGNVREDGSGPSYTEGISDTKFRLNLLKTGTPGNYNYQDVTELSKSQQDARTGMRTWAPTTTRITDSIALYLPGSLSSDLAATYDDAAMGVIGFAAATGLNFSNQMGADDFEGAAKTLKNAVGSVGEEIVQ